jgi:hypothetical protein
MARAPKSAAVLDFEAPAALPDEEPAVISAATAPAAKRPAVPAPPKAKSAREVVCGRCSTADNEVLCVPDPQAPGWRKCPQGCGFRHKLPPRVRGGGGRR